MISQFKQQFKFALTFLGLSLINVLPANAAVSDVILQEGGLFDTTFGEQGANIAEETAGDPTELAVQIGNIIFQVLNFLGIVILVMVIYAGILWLTAGGNSSKADQAKTILFNAFMGALIIGSAYAITAAVLLLTQ